VDRREFQQLRNALDKEIDVDIEFVKDKNLDQNVVVFEGASLRNSFGFEIVVNGWYNHKTRHTKYNFVLQGVGPICRVEVNGPVHGDAGRTHKHELQTESDPRRDLPNAIPRLDLVDCGPRELWEDLCKRAHIDHTGRFVDPTGEQ